MLKRKSKEKQDIMIVAHEFAKQRLLSSKKANFTEFHNHMISHGFKDRKLNVHIYGSIFVPSYNLNPMSHQAQIFRSKMKNGKTIYEDYKHDMLPEAYFNLVELNELRDAKKNAREARVLAFVAIVVSVVAICVTIFNTQNVRLDSYQLQKIIEAVNK